MKEKLITDQTFPRPLPLPDGYINPNRFVESLVDSQIEELADEYFKKIKEVDFLLAKPFVWNGGVPTLLGDFAALIHSLDLFVGCSILDFAAGSCWTSRYLAQMGGNVVATDISRTALEIGKKLLATTPIIGQHGKIDFAKSSEIFNNKEFQEYFDRISIMDAFHHLPNYERTLTELFQVLKPGGILVMSEPGRWHSRTDSAQAEMRHHQVLERDFDVYEVSAIAEKVGFERIESGVFSPIPAFVPFQSHNEVLWNHDSYLSTQIKNYMTNHSLVRMFKPGTEKRDSRRAEGLAAEMSFSWTDKLLTIKNIGESLWLASGNSVGCVNLGFTRLNKDGTLGSVGEWRIEFTKNIVLPGETVKVFLKDSFLFELPDKFEIDMYATGITWFKTLGSKTLVVSKVG